MYIINMFICNCIVIYIYTYIGHAIHILDALAPVHGPPQITHERASNRIYFPSKLACKRSAHCASLA